MFPKGQLVISARHHDELVWSVLTLVLMPVTGIGAGQAAQRQQPRHEAEIGVCFTGPDKLAHLIESCEVVAGLGRQRSFRHGFSSY